MQALHSLQVGTVPHKLRAGTPRTATLCGASERANEREVDAALILVGCLVIHLQSDYANGCACRAINKPSGLYAIFLWEDQGDAELERHTSQV